MLPLPEPPPLEALFAFLPLPLAAPFLVPAPPAPATGLADPEASPPAVPRRKAEASRAPWSAAESPSLMGR